MSEKNRNPKKLATNTYHCFSMKHWLIMAFMLTLCLLPFITLGLLKVTGSYNQVIWEDYYTPNSDAVNYTIEGNYQTNVYNSSVTQVRTPTKFGEFAVPIEDTGIYQNISFGSRQYQFLMNHTSDITLTTQYQFEPRMIYQYYPFLFGLPIAPLIGETKFVYDYITDTNIYSLNFTQKDFMLASNWTDIWNNLDIYFYYVDENNEGIAFNYGKNESTTSEGIPMTLNTTFGALDLSVYYLNISADLRIEGKPTPKPTLYYHSKPIDNKSMLYDYFALMGDMNPIDLLRDTLSIVNLGENVYERNSYDEVLIELFQIAGCPSRYEFPQHIAEKCGFYIHVKKEFNLTQYYNLWTPFELKDIADPIRKEEFLNGFAFYDGGLLLGKVIPAIENLQQVLIYDILIVLGVMGLIVVLMIVLKYPDREKTQQEARKMYCKYE